MPPSPDAIIGQIRGGSLLSATLLVDLDCDAILDARDSDPTFEQEWLAARKSLAAKWKSKLPSPAVRMAVDDLRRESFLAVSTATKQHELSAYCV